MKRNALKCTHAYRTHTHINQQQLAILPKITVFLHSHKIQRGAVLSKSKRYYGYTALNEYVFIGCTMYTLTSVSKLLHRYPSFFSFFFGRTDGCTSANSGNMKIQHAHQRENSTLFISTLSLSVTLSLTQIIIKTFTKPF